MLPKAIRPFCGMARPPFCRASIIASGRPKARDAEAAMTPDDFLGRVRDLVPAIRERTARAEQLRRLPDETLADFQEAGLFRAMQPKRYGGFELDPGTVYQGGIEIAAGCASPG